jgi:hypothetical protein
MVMAKKIFTEEELAWIEANFQTMTLKECARFLQISQDLLSRTAKNMGLYAGRKRSIEQNVNREISIIQQSKGYCLDCAYYKTGGICGKNKRLTGALHKKKCFTLKECDK